MWSRMLLRLVFLAAPAIIGAAAAVFWARNFLVARGVRIDSFSYTLVLGIAIWLAMWLTTKPLFDELRRQKAKKDGS